MPEAMPGLPDLLRTQVDVRGEWMDAARSRVRVEVTRAGAGLRIRVAAAEGADPFESVFSAAPT